MPLNYRKNSINCSEIQYYDDVSELNGPGISQTNRINIRYNNRDRYIGLLSNNTHEQSSDLNIRLNNENFVLAKRSKSITDKNLAWGNVKNQLGTNSQTSFSCLPSLVCGGNFFKCIINNNGASSHVIGITNNNTLFSWGSNDYGQLGNNESGNTSLINKCIPVAVCCNFLYSFVTIGGTLNATNLGITTTNKLYGWGYNGTRLLGNGTTTSSCVPISICPSLNFRCAWIGGDVAWALTTTGQLYGWGDNSSVSGFGLLGDGGTGVRATPCLITALNVCKFIPNLNIFNANIVNYIIDSNNRLYAWGTNGLGTIGNCSASQYIYTPSLVCSTCLFTDALSINFSSYAVTSDNKFYSWGSNTCGKLGNGQLTGSCSPTLISGGYNFCKLIISNCNGFGLLSDGSLYSWGDNTVGQLGISSSGTHSCIPVKVCGGEYIDITSNSNSRITFLTSPSTVLAIRKSDSRLVGWGCNCCGILGNGNTTNQNTPSLVCCDYKYTCITTQSCGCYALGIRDNYKIYGWGLNNFGYLGDGTIINKLQPTQISSNNTFNCIYPYNTYVITSAVSWPTAENLSPPSGLFYSSDYVTPRISSTVNYTPTLLNVGTGTLTYSISSTLPSGLNFNTSTGVISGTTPSTTSDVNYTVTATNNIGSTSTTIRIRIVILNTIMTLGGDIDGEGYGFVGFDDSATSSGGSLASSTFRNGIVKAVIASVDSYGATFYGIGMTISYSASNNDNASFKRIIWNGVTYLRSSLVYSTDGSTYSNWSSNGGTPPFDLGNFIGTGVPATTPLIIE
jgi:alpha-tubulin suppressor-like RCC1 family protein